MNALLVLIAGSLAAFFARRPVWPRVPRYLMGAVLAGPAGRIAELEDILAERLQEVRTRRGRG